MSLETEAVLDRRRIRRSLTLWRVLAVLAAILAVVAFAALGEGGLSGKPKQIARITVEGLITDDRDQQRMLKKIADTDSVAALLVFVNSPGGTTTGGEALFELLRQVAAKKPVVAQFGTIAASAAYITGLACDHIVARGNTITGSVGVIFQWAEVSQLLEKIGVKMNEVKSGPLKANPSPFQPIDEAGRRLTQQMVAESQKWFLGLVADRRKIDPASVPGLVDGRVFSGREALGHKLIDAIGAEKEAVAWLETERKVPKGLKLVNWKPKKEDADWFGSLTESLSSSFRGLFDPVARLLEASPLRIDGLVSVWQPSKNEQ